VKSPFERKIRAIIIEKPIICPFCHHLFSKEETILREDILGMKVKECPECQGSWLEYPE